MLHVAWLWWQVCTQPPRAATPIAEAPRLRLEKVAGAAGVQFEAHVSRWLLFECDKGADDIYGVLEIFPLDFVAHSQESLRRQLPR